MIFLEQSIDFSKISRFEVIDDENLLYIETNDGHKYYFIFDNYLKLVSGYILFLKNIKI